MGICVMKLDFGTFSGGRGHYPDIGQLYAFLPCALVKQHQHMIIRTSLCVPFTLWP
jgi:hypothetical protein